MSAAPDYDPHSPFIEYVEHGWRLCPVQPGTKGPRLKGWNQAENAITDPLQAGRLAGETTPPRGGGGLVLNYPKNQKSSARVSRPPGGWV